MADGSQENLLLRLIPEDPDPKHNELTPRAPSTPSNKDEADPDLYGVADRPFIDHYADTFNLRKKVPQPGFAPGFGPSPIEFASAKETLFRLSLTTPGNFGPIFSSWASTLDRIWIASHLGDPVGATAHDFIRLMAHQPKTRNDVKIQMVIRNGVDQGDSFIRTFFFIPTPTTRIALGVPVTSITYRIFIHDQASDTLTETLNRPTFTVVGSTIFEVRTAFVFSGWRPAGSAEPSNVLWVFAALSNNTMRAARSINSGGSWTDVGAVAANMDFTGAIQVVQHNSAWEFDFPPSFFGVYDNSTGGISEFSGDIFDVTAAVLTVVLRKATGRLAPAGKIGYIAGKRGQWGRGTTVATNDVVNLSGPWRAWPFYDAGTLTYGVYINGGNPVNVDATFSYGPTADVYEPAGVAACANRVFASFYRPLTRTGELRVIVPHSSLLTDETAGGGIPWPFTHPAGTVFTGALDAIDNTLFMPYVRDLGGGNIEHGIVVGEVDQAARPIGAGDITWTFVPTDNGNLTGWLPQTLGQMSESLMSFEPFPDPAGQHELQIRRDDGFLTFWFETALKRLRVTIWPLSGFPAGGSVIFDGDETDRVGSPGDEDGRFIFFNDQSPAPDANDHYLVRAEAIDSDGLIYRTTEIPVYLEPEVGLAVNHWRSFLYTTATVTAGDADIQLVTGSLLPASVTSAYGSWFEPTIDDPIEGLGIGGYPGDEDDLVIDLFEARNAPGNNERHSLYHATWARTLRSATYDDGGDWVSGVNGVRSLDITFQISSARVIVKNGENGTISPGDSSPGSVTFYMVLYDLTTQSIIHTFDSWTYNVGPGDINGTDNTVRGGSTSYMGALPSSWQVGILTEVSTDWDSTPNAIFRTIFYRVDAMTLSIQPTGNVALP